jgi:hypothetical protein
MRKSQKTVELSGESFFANQTTIPTTSNAIQLPDAKAVKGSSRQIPATHPITKDVKNYHFKIAVNSVRAETRHAPAPRAPKKKEKGKEKRPGLISAWIRNRTRVSGKFTPAPFPGQQKAPRCGALRSRGTP